MIPREFSTSYNFVFCSKDVNMCPYCFAISARHCKHFPQKKHIKFDRFVCSPCLAELSSTFTYKHQEQNWKDDDYSIQTQGFPRYSTKDMISAMTRAAAVNCSWYFLEYCWKHLQTFRWMFFREPCLDGWMCLTIEWTNSNVWILPCHLLKSTIKLSFIFTLLLVQLSCDRQLLYSKANSICMNACIYIPIYTHYIRIYMAHVFRICVCTHRCYM